LLLHQFEVPLLRGYLLAEAGAPIPLEAPLDGRDIADQALLLRRDGAQMKEIGVRPDLLLRKGDVRYNVNMLPGDVLIIPESRF